MPFEAMAVLFVFAVGVALAGFGLFVLGAAAQPTWSWLRAVQSTRWPTTSGTVTRAIVTATSQRGTRYFGAGLVYSYQVAGRSYLGTRESFADAESEDRAAAERVVARFRKGSSVAVHYRAQEPQLAVLDVRRPALLRWLQLPMSVGGAAFVAAGATILSHLLIDPLDFPTDGLPSAPHQIGWLVLGLAAALGLVAAVRGIGQRGRRRLARRILAAPTTAISALHEGQLASIFGRAERVAELVDSTLSDERLVYERARVSTPGGSELLMHVSEGALRVDDGSGSLLVKTEHAVAELRSRLLPLEPRVTDWVDQSLHEARLQFQVEQQTIAEGSQVLAIGVVTRDHESRKLVLCAQGYDADYPADPDPTLPGSLVLADQSRDALLARLTRGPRSTLALAISAVALLVTGSMLLAR